MPPSKDGKFWGQEFSEQAYAVPQPGKWYCVELMARCNTPGRDDGEAAFWLDGVPLAQHKGINWRSSQKLKLNGFWLLYYVTSQEAKDSKPGKVNRAWFDDIIVATDYVGPPAPGASAQPAPQAAPEGTPTYRLKEQVRDVMGQVERRTVPDE